MSIHVQVSLLAPRREKNPGFVLVENAMVDGAATGALQAPLVAPSSGLGPTNDTNAAPMVPAAPALAEGALANTTCHLGSDAGSGRGQRGARAY